MLPISTRDVMLGRVVDRLELLQFISPWTALHSRQRAHWVARFQVCCPITAVWFGQFVDSKSKSPANCRSALRDIAYNICRSPISILSFSSDVNSRCLASPSCGYYRFLLSSSILPPSDVRLTSAITASWHCPFRVTARHVAASNFQAVAVTQHLSSLLHSVLVASSATPRVTSLSFYYWLNLSSLSFNYV